MRSGNMRASVRVDDMDPEWIELDWLSFAFNDLLEFHLAGHGYKEGAD